MPAFLFLAALVAVNLHILAKSRQRVFSELDRLPENKVGLVLGTSKWVRSGGTNPFFRYRMEAAARLYHAKKVHHLLVSGDNRERRYNEPLEMRKSLLALGVPEHAITLDYAGLRTLDSVVRAKKVFGQDSLTIISQENHNYRAVYIADFYGVNAVAYSANAPQYRQKVLIREYLARVKAFLDLYILRTEPRYLGDPVKIGDP